MLLLIERGLAQREESEARAERQLEAWRALAGSWHSDESFEEEFAALYSARTPGHDADR